MEFMNVGGGELLIIILLALVLFSPEDILKLMRTLGNYARTARQMWANVSKSIQDDYIPDEVKEVVKETASSVKEAKTTLSSVRSQLNTMTSSVKNDVEDATKLADNELAQALTTVNASQKAKEPENSILNASKTTPSQSSANTTAIKPPESSASDGQDAIINLSATPEIKPTVSESNGQSESVQEEPIIPASSTLDTVFEPSDTIFTDDALTLTKETATKIQAYEGAMHANGVYTKLAKMTEDSLKDGEDDS